MSALGAAAQEPVAEEDAAAQFELAEQYYRDGRYEEAAEVLARLAESIPDPVLFYNLGRAYESAGQLQPAVQAYERYLTLAPDAKDADAVAARVGRLQERVAEAAEEDARTPEPAPPPPVVSPEVVDPGPARSRAATAAPWVLVGVGGGGVVAGIALVVSASSRHADARAERVQARAADLDAQSRRLALAGNIAFAAGGTLALAGLTWGLVRLRRDQRRRRDIAWSPRGVHF